VVLLELLEQTSCLGSLIHLLLLLGLQLVLRLVGLPDI
jgi:hypothetical protein